MDRVRRTIKLAICTSITIMTVGLVLFHETLTFLQIVGAVIIVAASLGMELAEKPAVGIAEQNKQ